MRTPTQLAAFTAGLAVPAAGVAAGLSVSAEGYTLQPDTPVVPVGRFLDAQHGGVVHTAATATATTAAAAAPATAHAGRAAPAHAH